jgi:hypothetical protein
VVVDLSDLHVKPYRDPIKALVHYTTPKDILHVFINGEHVVTNGSIPGLNERRVLNDVQEVYDKMGQIFVEWSGLRDDHSHFPTSYPLEPAFDSRR